MDNRVVVCRDCQQPFAYAYKGTGFLPARCPPCTRRWRNAQRVAQKRRARGTPEIGQVYRRPCTKCGKPTGHIHKGKRGPSRCPECVQRDNRLLWRIKRRDHAPYRLKPSDWARVLDAFGHRCGYCHRKDVALEIEHFIPWRLGGRMVMGNALPACRSCNARKSRKHPRDFLSPRQYDSIVKVLAKLQADVSV